MNTRNLDRILCNIQGLKKLQAWGDILEQTSPMVEIDSDILLGQVQR